MSDDYKDILKVATQAARAGSEVLRAHFGHLKQISLKKHAGLVTEADIASEKKIIEIIQSAFPEHSILAEETGKHEKPSPYKWVIDPLDGTTNYAHQLPIFCTSIGVEKEGKIIVSAIMEPLHETLYTAVLGQGAFKNGEPLSISKTPKLSEALIATGFAYQKGVLLDEAIKILRPLMEVSRGIRRSGSAVWDLCQVAEGHFDAFWEKNLQPWDVAAGWLLIEEAGGRISHFDGTTATIYDREILTSNGCLHAQMIELINKH